MDLSRLVPVDEIEGEDSGETEELLAMLVRAKRYISSFDWCPPIAEARLGLGIGGVVAVFLFRFKQLIEGDEFLWVVEGDLPSAYLVIDGADDAISALENYCELMENWAEAVEKGKPLEDFFPVDAPANVKYAAMLRSRTDFIRTRILPEFKDR